MNEYRREYERRQVRDFTIMCDHEGWPWRHLADDDLRDVALDGGVPPEPQRRAVVDRLPRVVRRGIAYVRTLLASSIV